MLGKACGNLNAILNALLVDCPYDLYWYDKVSGVSVTASSVLTYYDNELEYEVISISGDLIFFFSVADDYKAEEPYNVDASAIEAVKTAVANAQAIVNKYSDSPDYEKLKGYKDEICKLVSYNYDALGEEVNYGNPWQLIWVFDQDPNSNVVCEGYAKAFQYLCDLSSFDEGVVCYTVTGNMQGGTGAGPHMWNVVHINDGTNYLVDVTNCDDGSIGASYLLFMAAADNGNVQDGYHFVCSGNTIDYYYDEDCLSVYSTDSITISPTRFTAYDIPITIDSFPDEAFRSYVCDNYDVNQDQILSLSEYSSVTELVAMDLGIQSLQGIEVFSSMRTLWCGNNRIREIDLSFAPHLYSLNCENNQITSLDISRNPELSQLLCSDNQISEIDISPASNLKYFDCQDNKLTSLDLSHNPALIQIICQVNDLGTLDVTQNPNLQSLWCSETNLYTLDLSNNVLLEELFIGYNHLQTLDLSNNPNLTDIRGNGTNFRQLSGAQNAYVIDDVLPDVDITKVSNWQGASYDAEQSVLTTFTNNIVHYDYDCGNGHVLTFGLYFMDDGSIELNENAFPDQVFRGYISDNFDNNKDGALSFAELCSIRDIYISSMGVYSVKGIEVFPELTNLNCGNNSIEEIHISSRGLNSLLCSDNNLRVLDIGMQTALNCLDFANNDIYELDMSKFPALEALDCPANHFTTLNLQNNENLMELNCERNSIEEIHINSRKMNTLYCNYNNLRVLDIGMQKELISLDLAYNDLYELDTSQFPALESLDCGGNHLTVLNLQNNENVTDLVCYWNDLTQISFPENGNYWRIYCNNNQLTELQVQDFQRLHELKCDQNMLEYLDISNCNSLIEAILHGEGSSGKWWHTEIDGDDCFLQYDPGTLLRFPHEHDIVGRVNYVKVTGNTPGYTGDEVCSLCDETIHTGHTIPSLDTLNVLHLPNSLTHIHEEAFQNSPCQAVIIPDACLSIDARAFANCTELLYVLMPENTTVAEDAFENCSLLFIDKQIEDG